MKKNLLLFLSLFLGCTLSGQSVQPFLASQYWTDIDQEISVENTVRQIIPNKYRTFQVNVSDLKNALRLVPTETNIGTENLGTEMYFPNPDGTFGRYRIWYSPIMHPELAAKFKDIRTYSGINIDNPSISIRFDVTPTGFHAMTYGGGTSVFIDPYAKGDTEHYIVYFKSDFVKSTGDQIVCSMDEDTYAAPYNSNAAEVGDCGKRHDYRLAVAATGEYTTFHGGTVALAQAAIVTTMNRVNGVFEKECATRMILIANNNLIVYTNAGTDPYTNGNPNLMISENQTNTDAVIGNANYDIGHVFGTNSGGLAGLGVVCNNSFKASGVTGSGAPIGDPFDIDYVAHEIGHQFNGNHTQYNDGCNRNDGTAIEPGSGATIMGYAGICSPDVQANSDAYFSTASLFEIRPFVAANTCDVEVIISNSAPAVTALSSYSIPISTPFVLTAAATDPDGTLSYCWEQINTWVSPTQTMPPAATNVSGPVFRSFLPVASPARYFPNLTAILANTTPTWEVLPSVGRAMSFRVTARDNYLTAGCTGEASNIVTTVAAAGPFLVTSPNTAVIYLGGSSQTVTWDVAGTTAAPVSCANVDILLTTDGGATFTTLLANTSNDGTQSVTMPNITTTTARVWIRCSNNIFFDVSNLNFSIVASAAPCAELFISEYIEGTSNNKAIEIYNPTASPITLTGNYSLRFYFNGSVSVGTTIALVGTVAANDVFVVAVNTANATILAQADQTSTSTFYNGDDAIELFKTSASSSVDIIGQIGFDPGTEWGTGLTSTADNTIRRKSTITGGDPIGSNVFDPSIEWDGFATDDFTNLGVYTSSCAVSCAITDITLSNTSACNNNGTPNDPTDDYFTANIVVTFSGAPGTGNLNLSGDVLAGGGSLTSSAPFASPVTFTGVRLKADNTSTTVTATFSASSSCTLTIVNGTTVPPCSVSCPTITAVISGNGNLCGSGNISTIPVITTITGGTGPYTVVYTDGFTNYTVTNYVSGTPISNPISFTSNFTLISVTDANACAALANGLSGTAMVFVSTGLMATVQSQTNPSSCLGNDGSITVQISGGIPPYVSYNWTTSNGSGIMANMPNQTALTGGTYTLIVTDNVGCSSAPLVVTLTAPCPCPTLSTTVTNTTCGQANGAIDLTLTGGTGPFTYLWSNGATTQDISGLTATTYSVTVSGTGCTGTNTSATLTNSNVGCCPMLSTSVTGATCGQSTGSVDLTVTGGLPIFTYLWSNGATTQDITGLAAGSYTVTVTSPGSCTGTSTSATVGTAPDLIPPTLTCQGNLSLSCSNQVPAANPSLVTITDNCPGPFGPVTQQGTGTISGQTCANRFTLTRIYQATDASGILGTCSQVIVVNDQTGPVFNESPLPGPLTLSCTDDLPLPVMLTGTDACGGGGSVPDVIWINEIHYDNTGIDMGEFIEVAGTAGLNLSDYQLILYNGNGGAVYNTLTLSGTIDNEVGGFGAVTFPYGSNVIQNGAPDGIALYKISTNMVIQFLGYEGTFQAVGGPANGIFATDIGVLEVGNEALGLSLQLTGTGTQYSNFTWQAPLAQTPGTLNVGEVINQLPVSIPATFMQTEMAGSCAGSRIVTRKWTLTDVCGNMTMHTQILNLNDADAPVLTPAPADTTILCSSPVPSVPNVIATDACDPMGIVNGPVWINELHYDNVGTDAGEFVEIAGRAGTNLSGYELFFYNGTTGMMGGTYDNFPLSGVIPNQSNGFGTLAFFIPGIQNGASDAIAFMQGATLIQFSSYEGTMTAIGGPVNGMLSTNIGVSEAGTEPLGQSLRLSGNGATAAAFTWNGPSAANPATPGQVNQGQTFPVQPPIGLAVTFNQTTSPPSPTCPQAYTITRKWSAADACGNMVMHQQIISVVDTVKPVIICPATTTVTLSLAGTFTVTIGSLVPTVTVTDNCTTAPIALSSIPLTVTCANEGQTVPFIISATDQCGNIGKCTTQVTVNPFPRCTPKILISDPCVCKNNATTLTNGQFGEQIKIESLTGLTWTVTSNVGFYSASSPAPPLAPIFIPIGTTFTEMPAGSGDYFLNGLHVDALGYSITVSNGAVSLTIGNSCQYPNPTITSDLSGEFCLFSDVVPLTGTPGDANIISQGFTVNGVPATQFDPSQGVGQYFIEYTVNGGTPKAFGPNDPGCVQKIGIYVNVVATPSQLICNNLIIVSLDATCVAEILPDMILEGTYGCFDDYKVELDKVVPLGNGPWVAPIVGISDLGKTYQARVTHLVSGIICWGNVKIEDKLAPILTCPDITLNCAITNYTPDYIFNVLGIAAGKPQAVDCSATTQTFIDTYVDLSCDDVINGVSDISAYVTRKWTAKDAWNNTTTCTQYIYFKRLHISDLILPLDKNVSCSNPNTDPTNTGAPKVVAFGQTISFSPNNTICEMQTAYVDTELPVCDGTFKIIRKWTIVDWCMPFTNTPPFGNPYYHTQIIKVNDDTGPVMACPPATTVNTNISQCCANADLPDILLEDNCSRVNNIGGMVVTFDPQTNEQTGMFPISGSLVNFPGNNLWDRDTMAEFGYTTACLPIGTHRVTYVATDDCGNTSTCSFALKVEDNIPPTPLCDAITAVSIGVDGDAYVPANAFDSGSYDNCSQVSFKARRMDSNGCQSNSSFRDQVRFCCSDVGSTILIVMRAYDVPVPNVDVSQTFQEEHSNDCMVSIVVNDKQKPTCISPAHVTVSCEQFDETLAHYGLPTVEDNCCLSDDYNFGGVEGLELAQTNKTNFDTVCNKGTIVRTFRAHDCYDQSSQCTQRIVVTYEQDYFVRFPNDVIVTVCDGTGNYGVPTFFGEDCELLGTSYEDLIFTVVTDACFKIERTWTVMNWCTFNPNLDGVYIPNPNPSNTVNAPINLTGPIVSPLGTPAPWAPTNVKINASDPLPTNYSTFYNPNANFYRYKQIIKIIDTQDPIVHNCSDTIQIFCDITTNQDVYWNDVALWDNTILSHDLCEGPTDLNILTSDECSNVNVIINYQLFLDLNNDGVKETVVQSTNFPPPGIVYYNNVNTPNFSGGTPLQFYSAPVPDNQKHKFTLLTTFSPDGTKKMASVRCNTIQSPTTYGIPELPYGTHQIKWFVSDGCGNETVCDYEFTVKDCKAPTATCWDLNTNIMAGGMTQVIWANDFIQYAEDNCTPKPFLKYSIRRSGTGTGFPTNPDGTPVTNIQFTCDELGPVAVEIWVIDLAGNADYCEAIMLVQDNAGNCGAQVSVAGILATETNDGLEEAGVELTSSHPSFPSVGLFDLSDVDGHFEFLQAIPLGSNYTVTPIEDENYLNGVTTYDLVLMSKHILGIEPLTSAYKQIAADANKSGSITTFDIVELRRLILGITSDLPNNTSWRFIEKSFAFPNPGNPFAMPFPEVTTVLDAMNDNMNVDFVAIKIGDVNNSVIANALMSADDRNVGTMMFDVNDQSVKAGEVFTARFKASEVVAGYQFTLKFAGLEVLDITPVTEGMTAANFGKFAEAVTTSFDGKTAGEFEVKFRATAGGQLSRMLSVSSSITRTEAYGQSGRQDVALRFNSANGSTISGVGFELYQNVPNPFVSKTQIGFNLPVAADATLRIFDETGRVVFQQSGAFAKGTNVITIDRAVLNTVGVLYYTVETGTDSATKKMIQTK